MTLQEVEKKINIFKQIRSCLKINELLDLLETMKEDIPIINESLKINEEGLRMGNQVEFRNNFKRQYMLIRDLIIETVNQNDK